MSVLRIKVCGITSVADGVLAAASGADAVGLNFYAKSPRFIAAEAARAILRELPPFVEAVALFVNQALPLIRETLLAYPRIRTVQCHGDRHELEAGFPWPRIPAFAVSGPEDLETIRRHVAESRELGQAPAAVLVDASVPGRYGGTGQIAPWQLLAGFDPGVPLILAGGLTPDNVAQAVRIVRPYAVDVASGVEESPGRKDPEKLRRFVANAQAALG